MTGSDVKVFRVVVVCTKWDVDGFYEASCAAVDMKSIIII